MSVQISEQDFYNMRNQRDQARTMAITREMELNQFRARIDTLEAENARLTAAHAMQGEELVTLPRHMVYSMEDKLKAQAAQIEAQGTEIRRLRNVIISYQAGNQ